VSGRKNNKIKIDSFEYILLFFSSADTKASPKETKPQQSKLIACPEKSGKTLKNYYD
jgi:hypothetical protein